MIKKFERLLKNIHLFILPTGSVLLSNFITILPYKSSSSSFLFMPFFPLMLIYFWSIYRPQSLPYFVIFILGLLKDILENGIFGLNAICFLLFQAMIRSQRKYIVNHTFIVIWSGFIFFSGIITVISVLLVKFNSDINIHPLSIIFSQWLITILVYVPIHYLLNKLRTSNSPLR